MTIMGILGYVLSCVCSYCLFRRLAKKLFPDTPWTNGDRAVSSVVSLFGPLSLAIMLGINFLELHKWDKPARW